MNFKGIDEAVKLLQSLSASERSRILDTISVKDPTMAQEISARLSSLEDLKYLTPSMLVGFLRDVDLKKLGLALRSIDKSISDLILAKLSTGIRLDIEEGLKAGLVSADIIQDAYSEVMDIFINKIESGQIIIDPDDVLV